MNSNILKIGQVLKIPSGKTYVVKKGDSLWKISKEYGVSINDLISKNNLKNTTIKVGQVLKV